MNLTFRKTGEEIKAAATSRIDQLQSRLDARNATLAEFLDDPLRVRSFMVRSSYRNMGHGGMRPSMLVGEGEVSSEEIEEIEQLCRRIFDLQEEKRLRIIIRHLAGDANVMLEYNELIAYGFSS